MQTISRNEEGVVQWEEDGVLAELDPSSWPLYRKQVPTAALRITSPFRVETSEGPLTCQDGYLCIDARGYPYPVAFEEFNLIYRLEGEKAHARPTIVGLLRGAQDRLHEERAGFSGGTSADAEAARECSIAITEIQTAIMFAQRAMARKHGLFNEIDVEAIALGAEDNRIVK